MHGNLVTTDPFFQSHQIVKPTGWVVDMRHYLDEETGDLPDGLPTPVLNLALFFGSIVAWVTDHLPRRARYCAPMDG